MPAPVLEEVGVDDAALGHVAVAPLDLVVRRRGGRLPGADQRLLVRDEGTGRVGGRGDADAAPVQAQAGHLGGEVEQPQAVDLDQVGGPVAAADGPAGLHRQGRRDVLPRSARRRGQRPGRAGPGRDRDPAAGVPGNRRVGDTAVGQHRLGAQDPVVVRPEPRAAVRGAQRGLLLDLGEAGLGVARHPPGLEFLGPRLRRVRTRLAARAALRGGAGDPDATRVMTRVMARATPAPSPQPRTLTSCEPMKIAPDAKSFVVGQVVVEGSPHHGDAVGTKSVGCHRGTRVAARGFPGPSA